ncbi:MAG: hypothetical protein WA364_10365 [Candidatus Nitrosopolaris sp.]
MTTKYRHFTMYNRTGTTGRIESKRRIVQKRSAKHNCKYSPIGVAECPPAQKANDEMRTYD